MKVMETQRRGLQSFNSAVFGDLVTTAPLKVSDNRGGGGFFYAIKPAGFDLGSFFL